MKLIIHADDLGLSREVNEGILAATQKGVVTSASLLVNFPSSREALSLASAENLDLGWHINLTEGRPLSRPEEIPSLVQGNGSFRPLRSLIGRSLLRGLDPKEIEKELQTQFRFFPEAGIVPTHIDGHEHVHVMPMIRQAVQRIARDHKIPFVRVPVERGGATLSSFAPQIFLRRLSRQPMFDHAREDLSTSTQHASKKESKTPVGFYGLAFRREAGKMEAWEKLLKRIVQSGCEAAEIMVHPSRSSEEGDPYPGDRVAEWRILMSQELKSLIDRMGFQLTSFKNDLA